MPTEAEDEYSIAIAGINDPHQQALLELQQRQ
jgi:hypothetical protein